MEKDETQDIFHECYNTLATRKEHEKSSNETNLGYINPINKRDNQKKDFANFKQNNNNHHVVHVGVIIVLLTLYLGMTSVQKCLVSCVENTASINEKSQNKAKTLNYPQEAEKLKNTQILEGLLEYKNICKDLEIFTKDIKRQQQQEKEGQKEKEESSNGKENSNDNFWENEVESSGGMKEDSSVEDDESSNNNSGSSGSGDYEKANIKKQKKAKYSIKTTNTKNGFNKYNKSMAKAKYQKNEKKDLNLNKKNSTAEPIIYLFALVFIYLLLKAASDINQHYKSQNKNDKRLRRCSLQSYAQTHRPDRRASKELALKQKQQQQQRLKSISRSSSQDQQNYHHTHHHHQQQQQQQYLMEGSPQISFELKQPATTIPSMRPNVSYSSNWQLLRQHTTQSLDNSDILNNTSGNSEISSSIMATRRCSVPAALNYQRQKIQLATASPLNIGHDHVSLSRRTSTTSLSLPLAIKEPNESLIPETKRRVRMINRH